MGCLLNIVNLTATLAEISFCVHTLNVLIINLKIESRLLPILEFWQNNKLNYTMFVTLFAFNVTLKFFAGFSALFIFLLLLMFYFCYYYYLVYGNY